MIPEQPSSQPGDLPGLVEFTRAWAKALAGTSYVPMTRAERHDFLLGRARRLAAALSAEPFTSTPGYEIGDELVIADFAAPEALGRTVEVIDDRFLADLGMVDDRTRGRLALLLGALAAGYSWALRDRTLDEQEAIRFAALVARDEAEQALRASEARFRYAALHDPLTGLPNRALFADRLTEIFTAPSPAARLGVCFVDLDAFKAVNDSLGHRVGDQLLIAAAQRLSGLAGELGYLVARLGGDEFVVLIEDTTCPEDAIKVADRVLATIGEPFTVDGHDLPVTASIGIVERFVAGTDPTDVMRAADITLHWAKADGKARWRVFDEDRNAKEVARYTLAAAMPGALERSEFRLLYQPIVDLATGRLAGVEALARWSHPQLGMLTPDEFIGLAEDRGLIVALGIRLLEQACQQAAYWYELAPHAPYVSVNLAVRQVRHPGLVADVIAVLDRTGLPPGRLQLEITESAVMDNDDDETLTTLRDLANLGVRLAIDDFGTGYSNLAYLRALPVQGLKLAGPFVQGLRTATVDPTDEAIVATLVSLGHTLGLVVTAEGVETHTQAERLRTVGCDAAQGWHFGRPVPSAQIIGALSGR
ncbi:MAG: GGDEF-domain containing protein [Actinobacteria bacterium 13_2_20CM_2_71_6]|nr:MAG: GGDEF-domain containing protein [Actinobacteria bacterium 13_2_20CM_2_71_6]